MDKTLQYTQVTPNFGSAYNVAPDRPSFSSTYIPLSSSSIFSTFTGRPTSPLFHRCTSPPARRPVILTESVPKFNFNLYKMDRTVDEYDDYIPSSSSIYRPLSPTLSRTVYHHPIHSSLSSPTSETPSLSKLRQINNELSRTLAQSDYSDPLAFSSTETAPHYHIHHYPLSQYSSTKHRSTSRSDDGGSSIEVPVPSNIRKARVLYKIHVPRRTQHKSASNVDRRNEQIVVDLYPTREKAFVKQKTKRSDNQSPWIVTGESIQYDSYSDTTSASETPRDAYYGGKLISSSHRSTHRPSSTKHSERIWYPPRQSTSQRSPKSNKYSAREETESEPVSYRRPSSDRTKVRTNDPKIKSRIANTKSKVKSTWEPTITSLHQPDENESKSSIPVQKPTSNTTPKPNIKSVPSEPTTPTKPSREATSKNVTIDDGNNSRQNQSHRLDSSRKQKKSPSNSSSLHEVKGLPSSSSASEKEQTPRPQLPTQPSNKIPRPHTPELDEDNESTIEGDALVHGNDTNPNHDQNSTPAPANTNNDHRDKSSVPNPQPSSSKSPKNDEQPPVPKINNEDDDENDQEVAQSFDIQKWLSDASRAILNPSKENDIAVPSTPPPQPEPDRPKRKSPPRRKQQPPSPPPDENLYKPPFGPKQTEQTIPRSPTPAPASTNDSDDDAAADFFS